MQDQVVNIVKHPAKSPDLNPIEKIWGLLKTKVYDKNNIVYWDRRILKKKIVEEWNKISKEEVRKFIDDLYDNRLNWVIQNGGELIK